MRKQLVIFALAIFPAMVAVPTPASPPLAVSAGDTDPRQEQLQAATANAVADLRDQILRARLSRDITVNDFLDRTNSQAELARILKNAQPVGGPRWVDDHTCQVRLELPASSVAAMLMGVAHTPSQHAPLKPETLKLKFNDWNKVNFSSVGSSVGGDALDSAKPKEVVGKWDEVSDSARKSAIVQARADAAGQMTKAIGPILLTEKIHASDALARPAIADSFDKWLHHRPVTRIEFLDDLNVSVTISIAPKSLSNAFKSAVEADPDFVHSTKIDWDQVDHQLEELPASMAGTGAAVVAGPATSLPSIVLPLQPPDWVDQQLQADASASGNGSRLKVGHAAETDAIGKLRDQFLLLHIDPATTLGDAAHSDPQLKQAVDRALLHAHTYRVDYHSDGSVKVQVSLDLRDAWDALRSDP
jgi:hypothetical protein